MDKSGRGNDGLLILVPVGVLAVAGVLFVGGPAEALVAVNEVVGDVADAVIAFFSALV